MTVEHMVNMPSKANNDGFEQEPQFDYFGESSLYIYPFWFIEVWYYFYNYIPSRTLYEPMHESGRISLLMPPFQNRMNGRRQKQVAG